MDKLTPATRHYSWGSRTLIPELLGQEPTSQPVAELWYGAHPADPSMAGERPLSDIIAADPAQLGEWEEKGQGLPFLMKLLAADEVLSLQAHPSLAQAREGFERENALGIALDDPQRNYKDANHKPEIIIALTPFYAMAGFRPLARTRELFAALGCPELEHYLSMLAPGEDPETESDNLRALFTTWITIPSSVRRELIDAVVSAAPRVPAGWMKGVMDTVVAINEQYPGDIGVLGALLLNHVELAPGEALFLGAGHLHAYVRGLGVEVMANSDNVLRGGLTPKYVDVPELVKVLEFGVLDDPRVDAQPIAGGVEYPTPVDEFTVRRYDVEPGATVELDVDGPAIALCTSGTVAVGDAELAPGDAVWLPATRGAGEATMSVSAASADSSAHLFVSWA